MLFLVLVFASFFLALPYFPCYLLIPFDFNLLSNLLSKSTPDIQTFILSLCRMEAVGYQRVLQVDLEVNGLMVTQGSREVAWQVEYPLTRTLTSEVQTLIRLAPQDLGGIVPLAMVRSDWLEIGSMCA